MSLYLGFSNWPVHLKILLLESVLISVQVICASGCCCSLTIFILLCVMVDNGCFI